MSLTPSQLSRLQILFVFVFLYVRLQVYTLYLCVCDSNGAEKGKVGVKVTTLYAIAIRFGAVKCRAHLS